MEEDAMNIDPAGDVETANIAKQKIVNEEYKVWKKHAVFLYDIILSRALDWPTLTTQWFPDKVTPPGEGKSVHRLLLGTHTDEETKPNYLQIAHISIPENKANPEEFDDERGEIGGYGAGKKNQGEMTFKIEQKIDHPGEVNKARYMPQNPNIIATMCNDGTVSPQIELTGHTKEGFGLNWNPNVEGQIATASNDQTVKVWDIKDFTREHKKMKAARTFTHHASVVNDLEFHHKFDWMLATVSDDRTLQILDLRQDSTTKAVQAVEDAHSNVINCVAFNQGTDVLLATGSADRTVGIWDVRFLQQKLHVCESHKEPISKIEWHPFEKQVLASSSADRRVIYWDLSKCGEEQAPEDAEDGPPELLFIHGGHTDCVSDFSFNKNDPWLMCSAADDNLLQIWQPSKSLVGKDTAGVALEQLEK